MQEGSWENVRSSLGQKLLQSLSLYVFNERKKKTKNSGMRITKGYLRQDTSMKAGRK